MGSARARTAAALLALAVACSSEAPPIPTATARGGAQIDAAVVERHAQEFEADLAGREAGSPTELAAAAYLLAHLQQAGYVGRLEGVPVGDLVRSTNVVASIPEGEEGPAVAVFVVYDEPPGSPQPAGGIGLFLELARAASVRGIAMGVEFVALGAEHSDASGGRLGSRRYAALARSSGRIPEIVIVISPDAAGPVRVAGPLGAELEMLGRAAGIQVRPVPPGDLAGAGTVDVLGRIVPQWALVAGSPQAAGGLLLELIAGREPS